jgi:hypothetical protein
MADGLLVVSEQELIIQTTMEPHGLIQHHHIQIKLGHSDMDIVLLHPLDKEPAIHLRFPQILEHPGPEKDYCSLDMEMILNTMAVFG